MEKHLGNLVKMSKHKDIGTRNYIKEIMSQTLSLYDVFTQCSWFPPHKHGDNIKIGGDNGFYEIEYSEKAGGDERVELIFSKGKANPLPTTVLAPLFQTNFDDEDENSDDPKPPVEPMD